MNSCRVFKPRENNKYIDISVGYKNPRLAYSLWIYGISFVLHCIKIFLFSPKQLKWRHYFLLTLCKNNLVLFMGGATCILGI